MKKKLNIINKGKIMIDGKFTHSTDEDHTQISIYEDGMEFPKFTLTVPGLKALYMEIGDHLRDFEALRNPR
jgi:hypothetical protein